MLQNCTGKDSQPCRRRHSMTATRTNVLHVIACRGVGGAENMLASLVTAPRTSPISQVVVNLMAETVLTEQMRAAGVEVHELDLRSPAGMPAALIRLAGIIRSLKPSAIQSWLYYADLMSLWALRLSGQRASTRLYWGVRCSNMDQDRYRAQLRWTIAACSRRSTQPDAVVANSFIGRDVHRKLGYAPRAFPVIVNGIDTQRFRPNEPDRARIRTELGIAPDANVAIHAARVDPMKDHDSLLSIAAANPDVTFVMAGAGTEKLAKPQNVIALGLRRDMPSLYAAADVALSTSAFGEGFPNTTGEAMAAGVPVLATDVGDSRRIVGDTGLTVPPRDTDTMIAALRRLLGEPQSSRRNRADAARRRIEQHYSLARAVAAFDALHLHNTLPDPAEQDMSG